MRMSTYPTLSITAVMAALAVVLQSKPAEGAELVAKVSGARSETGVIGCALFAAELGFPMDNSAARQLWVPVEAGSATCRFADVPAGRYAISVLHDLNGNRKVDTNLFGIPKEGWAVSNNAAPRLRAPRFDEAAFVVDDAPLIQLDLRLVH